MNLPAQCQLKSLNCVANSATPSAFNCVTHGQLRTEPNTVGVVADFLRIQSDLFNWTDLNEATNNLVRDVGLPVDAQREGRIAEANNITKLLATSKLLEKGWGREQQGFELVKPALLYKDAKILENRSKPARW